MSPLVQPMTMADYEEAIALWRACEGLGLSAADEREPISHFLEREGITKCHLFVLGENREALRFWKRAGWTERIELSLWSFAVGPQG